MFAATGDVLSVVVNPDGWSVNVAFSGMVTGGVYNLGHGTNNSITGNETLVLNLTSTGYANGIASTTSQTNYGTLNVRQVYPNQNVNQETNNGTACTNRIALSHAICVGDSSITATIKAGLYTANSTANNAASVSVVNNSTNPYPKVIGHFASQQRMPVNGTTTIEVFAAADSGRGGNPVSAVEVVAIGQSSGHTEIALTNRMLKSSSDSKPVYALNLPLSVSAGFTRGEVVKINFIATPIIGNTNSVLDAVKDAGAYAWQIGPLYYSIMDPVYSRVDFAGGNDTTGIASTNQSAADAAPVKTIGGARAKIIATNGVLWSLSRVDGGVIQLNAGQYPLPDTATDPVNSFFTVTHHSSTATAGVIFTNWIAANTYQPIYLRLKDVTISRIGSGYLVFAQSGRVLVMDGVADMDGFGAWYSGDINSDVEFFNCVSTNSRFSELTGSSAGGERIIRNSIYTNLNDSGSIFGAASFVFGNYAVAPNNTPWSAGPNPTVNAIIAYNQVYKISGNAFINGADKGITNMAILNNVAESYTTTALPISEISVPTFNLIGWNNTYAGQRFNHENDINPPYSDFTFQNYQWRNNILNSDGDHRADIHDTNSYQTGTWSVGFKVGWSGNFNEALTYGGDSDYYGLNTTNSNPAQHAGYVADRSNSGTQAGLGDYHLTSAAPARWIVTDQPLPYDIEGNARGPNDPPGAYIYTPPPNYTLTVNSGSGSGTYASNTVVSVVANSISGQTFSFWTGNTNTMDNPWSPSANITNNAPYTIIANYTINPPTVYGQGWAFPFFYR